MWFIFINSLWSVTSSNTHPPIPAITCYHGNVQSSHSGGCQSLCSCLCWYQNTHVKLSMRVTEGWVSSAAGCRLPSSSLAFLSLARFWILKGTWFRRSRPSPTHSSRNSHNGFFLIIRTRWLPHWNDGLSDFGYTDWMIKIISLLTVAFLLTVNKIVCFYISIYVKHCLSS